MAHGAHAGTGRSPRGTASASTRAGASPAQQRLLQQHRHSLINLLVMGGSADEREYIARAFHRESPLRSGPFIRLDCGADEDRLCRALLGWMSGANDFSDSSLITVERGTLFLDNVEALSDQAQRLLLTFVSHHVGVHPWSGETGWSGRLAAGSSAHLGDLVLEDRFLEALYDCLDKARIELDEAWQGSVA
jgi:DNA-binding NtrC family response regulator